MLPNLQELGRRIEQYERLLRDVVKELNNYFYIQPAMYRQPYHVKAISCHMLYQYIVRGLPEGEIG